VTRAFSGDLDKSHREGCAFVRGISCPQVREQADVVIVSGGGYPLDATFYQCVKGMVAALPLLAENGTVLCAGSCSEGIGSAEYSSLMKRYSGRWKRFYTDIRDETFFVKDQWQFQMQAKVLARTGMQNLVFLTDGLGDEQLKLLSVNGIACDRSDVQNRIQGLLQGYVSQNLKIAFIPEGPYCTPLPSAD